MPSTQTLSAFYTFVAGAIADAEQVNFNFSNFRGHLLPIDPNTATAAATKTYDLGSTEHKWGIGYFSALDISATLTTQMLISGLSAGAWSFAISSTSFFKITDAGYIGANATPMSISNPTASAGNIAARSTLNTTITSGGHIANSTCTLQTLGRPVMLSVMSPNYGDAPYFSTIDATTGSNAKGYAICFVIDGVLGPPIYAWANARARAAYPASAFYMIDTPAAGYHTYSLYVTATGGNYVQLNNIRLNAREF